MQRPFARALMFLLLAIAGLPGPWLVTAADSKIAAPAKDQPLTTPDARLGRWDLTIQQESKKFPSWLELTQTSDGLKARFVGRWGHARFLPQVSLDNQQLRFVSPKEEEDSKTDLAFTGTFQNGRFSGTAQGPDGAAWTWTSQRAPTLKPPMTVNWGNPIELINARDFTGWHFDNPGKSGSWKVENGSFVNAGGGANLITNQRFSNFKLHVEVNCPAGANSGIYLRGRYEVQVEDDSIQEPANHHMGAVYGYLAPNPEQPRQPGVWQTFDITLLGRYVTVVQNNHTIVDNQEIPGITGGALDSHEEQPGPIYLQGDHGGIAYRSVRITPAR